MLNINRYTLTILVVAVLALSACGPQIPITGEKEKVTPSSLEPIEGTDLSRVILTEKAAERIDVQTVEVNGNEVPYTAVIYDTKGNTWVYTNPEPLTYVRASIVIDHIDGDVAILARALDSGTSVVTVGVAELYGAETGVSK
ncbi:MAG: hypothetical protein AB1649_17945 [Chloroflexota bacterium]